MIDHRMIIALLNAAILAMSAVTLVCVDTAPIQAQSLKMNSTQLEETAYGPEEVRFLLTTSLGLGLVTGNIDADPGRFVRPGLAFTGMFKLFLLYKDPSRRFGPGVLVGICSTIGNRAVHEERDWPREGRRPLDGMYIRQSALFIGPMVQFGRQGGNLRYQIGFTWNRSKWNTNLYTNEDWVFKDATFMDDQVGAGAFICLTDNKFSCAIMYHEFEGRLLSSSTYSHM